MLTSNPLTAQLALDQPGVQLQLASATTTDEEMMEAAIAAVGTTAVLNGVADLTAQKDATQFATFWAMPPAQQRAFIAAGYEPLTESDIRDRHGGIFSGVNIPMSGKLRAIADAVAFDSVLGIETPWSEWSNSRENFEFGAQNVTPLALPFTLGIQTIGVGTRSFLIGMEYAEDQLARIYRTASILDPTGISGDDFESETFEQAGFQSAGFSPRTLWRAWNTAGADGEELHSDQARNEAADVLSTTADTIDDVGSDLFIAMRIAAGDQPDEIVQALGIEPTDEDYQKELDKLWASDGPLNDPRIQEAAQVLDRGKVSFGRDFARLLGLDDPDYWLTELLDPAAESLTRTLPVVPEIDAHTLISGTSDAGFLLLFDPTIVAGKTTRAVRAHRHWQLKADNLAAIDAWQDVTTMVRHADKTPFGFDDLRRAYTDRGLEPYLRANSTTAKLFGPRIDIHQADRLIRWQDRASEAFTKVEDIRRIDGAVMSGARSADDVAPELAQLHAQVSRIRRDTPHLNQLWQAAQKFHDEGGDLVNPENWWDFYRSIEGRKALQTTGATGFINGFTPLPDLGAGQRLLVNPTKTWMRKVFNPGKGAEGFLDEHAREIGLYLRQLHGDDVGGVEFDELLNGYAKAANVGFISMRVRDAGYEEAARIMSIVGRPGQHARRFVRRLAHRAHTSQRLMLNVDQSVEEFTWLAESGALAWMPQQMIDEAIGRFMLGDLKERIRVTKLFEQEALVRSGFLGVHGADHPAWKKFIDNADHTYGIVPTTSQIGGVPTKLGLFTTPLTGTEYEDIMLVMNFQELARQTRKLNLARVVFGGTVQNSMTEAAMTRLWKPAQLLRPGFIPRAAGEEAIAFVMRRGFREYFRSRAALRHAGMRRLRDGTIALTDEARESVLLRPINFGTYQLRKLAGMSDAQEHRRALLAVADRQDFRLLSPDEVRAAIGEEIVRFRGFSTKRNAFRRFDEFVFAKSLEQGDFFHRLGLSRVLSTDKTQATWRREWIGDDGLEATELLLAHPLYQKDLAEVSGMTFDPYGRTGDDAIQLLDQPYRTSRGQLRTVEMRGQVSRHTMVAPDDPLHYQAYTRKLERLFNDPVTEAIAQRALSRFVPPRELARLRQIVDGDPVQIMLDIQRAPQWAQGALHRWARTGKWPTGTKVDDIMRTLPDETADVVRRLVHTHSDNKPRDLIRLFSPNLNPDWMITDYDKLVERAVNVARHELRRTRSTGTLHSTVRGGGIGEHVAAAPSPHRTAVYLPMVNRTDLADIGTLLADDDVAAEFVQLVLDRLPTGFRQTVRDELVDSLIDGLDQVNFDDLSSMAFNNFTRGQDWIPLNFAGTTDPKIAKAVTDSLSEIRERFGQARSISYRTKARMARKDMSTRALHAATDMGDDIRRHGDDVYNFGAHMVSEAYEISDEVELAKVKLASGEVVWRTADEVVSPGYVLDDVDQDILNTLSATDEFMDVGEIRASMDAVVDDSGLLDWAEFNRRERRLRAELRRGHRAIDERIQSDIDELLDHDNVEDMLAWVEGADWSAHLGDEATVELVLSALADDTDLLRDYLNASVYSPARKELGELDELFRRLGRGEDGEVLERVLASGLTDEAAVEVLARQQVEELMAQLSTFANSNTDRNDVLFEIIDGFMTDDDYSDVAHVLNVAERMDLPITHSERLEPVRGNLWDNFVRHGFENVITPGVAAVIRTPHMHANIVDSLPEMRWLLNELTDPAFHRINADDIKLVDRALRFTPRGLSIDDIDHTLIADAPDFVRMVLALDADNVDDFVEAAEFIGLRYDPNDVGPVMAALRSRRVALEEFDTAVSTRALNRTMPFIDDHRIRSQFQETVLNLVPFWFAEEQFLKRWARGFYETPHALRKGQLLMEAGRNIGMIDEDQYGNEVFVWPMSEGMHRLMAPAFAFRYGDAPLGQAFSNPLTTRTEYMFPGMREDVGRMEFGPIGVLALNHLANAFPEFSDLRDDLLGDLGANRFDSGTELGQGILDATLPASASRFFRSVFNNFDHRALRAAEKDAIQYLMANEHDPGPGATAEELKEFNSKVTHLARALLSWRAFTGFMVGSGGDLAIERQVVDAEGNQQNATGLEISQEFRDIINMGVPIPDAISMLVERHGGWVTPYTVFATSTTSGAPIPATEQSLRFIESNGEFLEAFPLAAPWFLPQDRPTGEFGILERRARNEALAMELRNYDTPGEFVREIYFVEAAEEYFERKERVETSKLLVDSTIDDLDMARRLKSAIDDEWDDWSRSWKTLHPTFAEDIQGAQGRVRRAGLIDQIRLVLANPAVIPEVAHRDLLIKLMRATLTFDTAMENLSDIQTGEARRARDLHREQFYNRAKALVNQEPALATYFSSVVRPLIGIDNVTEIEFNLEVAVP